MQKSILEKDSRLNLRSSTGGSLFRPSPFLPRELVFHSLMTSTSSLSESSDPFFFPFPCFFFLLGRRDGEENRVSKSSRCKRHKGSTKRTNGGKIFYFFVLSSSEVILMDDSSVSEAMNSSILSSSKKPCKRVCSCESRLCDDIGQPNTQSWIVGSRNDA